MPYCSPDLVHVSHTHAHTHTSCKVIHCSPSQYDENKLEDLLRDVIENEAPPTAPLPSLDDSEEETEEEHCGIGECCAITST